MVENPQRPLVRGPTFIRLLARLSDVDVPSTKQSLSDQLSQWIDWTRAVALSRALDGKPSALEAEAPDFDSAEEASYARIRSSLASTIVRESGRVCAAPASSRAAVEARAPDAELTAPAAPDYKAFHQHYAAMQRAMLSATGKLRGRLRDMLAGTSAELARLADVDALMEVVLSPREHALLGSVPGLLGQHFERLRQHALEAHNQTSTEGETWAAAPDAWLDLFRRDMQGVLLAELDVRFLPLEGLLAALRTHSQGRHVQTFA